MLDYFRPRTLPGSPSFHLGSSDTATFDSIWKAAKAVENKCLLPNRKPGWQPVGTKGSIGVFLWATDSEINQQVTGLSAHQDGPLTLMNASREDVDDG